MAKPDPKWEGRRKPAAVVEPPVVAVAVAGREASATVERRHRLAAVEAWYEGANIYPSRDVLAWAESGVAAKNIDGLICCAQVAASAEAYGRASALEKP